ncbi:hypothetical protein SDC9_91048 [bioreactor metagenome]|uniref:Uncharacterized protein n=1 Tax=bioreactor metagenome TaxID=1076179 RepID=A0A644ZTS0_9ZZZZ
MKCQRVSESLSGNFYNMKIIRSQDCGNSPKNALLADLEVALAGRNLACLKEHTLSDLIWTIAGIGQGVGLTSLLVALDSDLAGSSVDEMEIASSFSHGKMGAVYGMRIDNIGKQYEFCSLYELSSAGSAKVKNIKIFQIEKICSD